MQDQRSAGSRSAAMAKDQPLQRQPAQVADASGDSLHDRPGSTNPIHNCHSSTLSPLSDDLSTTRNSQYSTTPIALPDPAPSHDSHRTAEADLSDRNLAHEAALRRLNRHDPHYNRESKPPDSGSVAASTQPVLVREYSQGSPTSNSPRQSKMKSTKRSSGHRSSEMPPLESFSFQDILASIDSDVHLSIDKIAEICGRSKLSMADEYSSHMPPQSDFSLPNLQGLSELIPTSRLDPVEEASSTHEVADDARSARSRVARLSLAGVATNPGDLLSAPVTATSAVASYSQPSGMEIGHRGSVNRDAYVPQFLAWLRTSRGNESRSSQASRRDSGAANALQRILSGPPETATL
ncbi:MAG: hypothetical protein L6R40_006106 [Gallowayella cf. fulva]|nr:MAG: hypothetical protein L6R40_006106 [Xanthomendoza cf. fulva]